MPLDQENKVMDALQAIAAARKRLDGQGLSAFGALDDAILALLHEIRCLDTRLDAQHERIKALEHPANTVWSTAEIEGEEGVWLPVTVITDTNEPATPAAETATPYDDVEGAHAARRGYRHAVADMQQERDAMDALVKASRSVLNTATPYDADAATSAIANLMANGYRRAVADMQQERDAVDALIAAIREALPNDGYITGPGWESRVHAHILAVTAARGGA